MHAKIASALQHDALCICAVLSTSFFPRAVLAQQLAFGSFRASIGMALEEAAAQHNSK